jgi:hypothetical protein
LKIFLSHHFSSYLLGRKMESMISAYQKSSLQYLIGDTVITPIFLYSLTLKELRGN